MSITVGAALKKIAVALLANPRALKTIGGILLGAILVVITPVLAMAVLLGGGVEIDTDQLQQTVTANLSSEQQSQLRQVEDTMYAIRDGMTAAGYPSRVKEAQVIYIAGLSNQTGQPDLVSRLVSCFSEGQTDAQLIAAVNAGFGASLDAGEFSQIMSGIRAVYIDTSDYMDPGSKNNLDLAAWAKHAAAAGWGYVWSTSGSVLTQGSYASLLSQYPSEVGRYADFIERNWLGGRTTDCSGLIRGYFYLNPTSGEMEYGYNGYEGLSANAYYAAATERGSIDTIPEIPGLAVWHQGHIGIYIGDGQVIEAMSTQRGVVQTGLASRSWTHWLKVPGITYIETTEETNESPVEEESST